MAFAAAKRDNPTGKPRFREVEVVDLCDSDASADREGQLKVRMEPPPEKAPEPLTEANLKRKFEVVANGNGEQKYESIYAKKEQVKEEEPESDSDSDSNGSAGGQSMFDEQFEETGDDVLLGIKNDPNTCSLQEARKYRRMLREMGPRAFIDETVCNDTVSARKLMTAFGCRIPQWLESEDDEVFYPHLQHAMIRELKKREKMDTLNTVDDAVALLKRSKNIMVLTGAGISTSLGIPDFRSKDIGLYAQVQHLGLDDPQEVFSLETFNRAPEIFFSVAKSIIPNLADHRYTPTHQFIKLLQDEGKLLTNYTQNIDNIERIAGVNPEKIIQCHGSFATATCTKCKTKVNGETIFPEMRKGIIPRCEACKAAIKAAPQRRKRKRKSGEHKKKKYAYEDSSEDDGKYDIPEAGIMKPDITFFGEALPRTFHDRLVEHDREKVDLIVVIGTSMKVAPVSEVVDFLHNVPTIYISREPVKHIYFDIDLIGDCDVVVAELCRRAGWKMEHEMVPRDQVVEATGDPNFPSRWLFKEKKKALNGKEAVKVDRPAVKAAVRQEEKREDKGMLFDESADDSD